jgi:hypothetical protein
MKWHAWEEYKWMQICDGETRRKRPLRKPRRRLQDDIKMDAKEMGFEFLLWIYVAQYT